MKILFTFLALSLLSLTSISQIVITKDTVWYPNFPADGNVHSLNDTMLNLGSNSKTITWKRGAALLQLGWTCSFVDDIAGSYGCADTTLHSFVLHPNQPGVFIMNMKANASADNGPVYVTLNTSEGNMTFVFGLGALGLDYSYLNSIQIYPQPFQNEIRFKGDMNDISTIELRNLFGNLVQRTENKANAVPILHTEQLSEGLYFLTLITINNQRKVYKLYKN